MARRRACDSAFLVALSNASPRSFCPLAASIATDPVASANLGPIEARIRTRQEPLTSVSDTSSVEMTGHYALILPLMVSSFIATFVADATGAPPVYDGLLESQLKE